MTVYHNDKYPQRELTPLVVVEGFLGGAGAVLWGDFERYLNNGCGEKSRRVIFASVGPVSSLHDRACELYYALRGGIVDYGDEHCKLHNHSRYGRANARGLYPQWSTQHPLHFLGHSIGGPTITKLQFLLDARYFRSDDHPDMILSINSGLVGILKELADCLKQSTPVSSPFRGTHLVYTLGERADAAPAVRPLSIGSFLAKCVHLVTYFSPLLPQALDLRAESRSLSYRDLSFAAWLGQLWHSDWAGSRDAVPFDMTYEAADEREFNAEGRAYPRTFHRSYVAVMQNSFVTDLISTPLLSLCAAPLYLTSRIMASFDFATIEPRPLFLDETIRASALSHSQSSTPEDMEPSLVSKKIGLEHKENDGIVPIFSQWHPLPCTMTRCIHEMQGSVDKPEPGTWYVTCEEKANHVSLVAFWTGAPHRQAFWGSIGSWLRKVERSHSRDSTTL